MRPPRVLTRSFPLMTVPFTAGAPCSYWTLTCLAVSSALYSLMGFLFVSPVVCLQLPSDSISRWTPLLFSYPLPTAGRGRDFHPIERAPAGRTRRSGNRFFRSPPSEIAFLAGFEPTTFRLGGGRSILLSYRNIFKFFPYFQGFPVFRVRAPRAPNRPFFIRRFRRFLEISNIVVCSVMEHTTLLDFSFVILPPENRADKFFLPHDRYFLRRRSLYPAELRGLMKLELIFTSSDKN